MSTDATTLPAPPPGAAILRIVTYNIHRARGMDRRTDARRIADVLAPLGADVIALQEVVGAGPRGHGHDEEIGAALGMGWVMGAARRRRGHLYGNIVLSRHPIVEHSQYDLTFRGRTPRCVVRADIQLEPGVLHVYNVHLGMTLAERRYQAGRLGTFVHDHRVTGPKILVGDFNEWVRGHTTRLLRATFSSLDLGGFLKRRRTYPGFFPVLHLDHVYYDGRVEALGASMPRDRRALVASDHLPLVADVLVRF